MYDHNESVTPLNCC